MCFSNKAIVMTWSRELCSPDTGGELELLFVTEELKPSNAEAYVTHQDLDECLRGRTFKIASALFCCASIYAGTI
jgi:hypothetical protein